MKKNLLFLSLMSLFFTKTYAQTETSNNEKINLQSPSNVSLFQSKSTSGVWATGTVTGDRWGVFEDATSAKERMTILPGGKVGIGVTNPTSLLHVNGEIRGSLRHNNGYFTMYPYASNYDDGSYVKSFYDGNKKQIVFWNSDPNTAYTRLQTGGLTISSRNPTLSSSGFANKIEFTGNSSSAIVHKSGDAKELMFGMHDNGNFYWGTGGSATKPNFYSMSLNGNTGDLTVYSWLRTRGTAGIFFETHKGGFHMTDDTWIRTYGNKSFYHNQGIMRTDGTLQVGPEGNRFVVNSTGNVGIGTKTPTSKLHVNGDFYLQGNNPSTNGWQTTNFYWKGHSLIMGSKPGRYAHNRIELKPGGASNGELISTLSLYQALGENNQEERVHITSSESHPTYFNAGNVGIGTKKPSQKLHIDALESAIQIRLQRTGTNSGITDFGTDNKGLHYWVGGYDGFGKEELMIGVDGNVGIGTNDTKGYKLGVNGKIAATEVKVALYSAWPDFVFKENYELPTLQEIENHIETKGHLENIPSAAEVAKNGIQLGEMNSKLLQKIEELTLYMIEQNKKTEHLIKEVEVLKQRNTELEKRMR